MGCCTEDDQSYEKKQSMVFSYGVSDDFGGIKVVMLMEFVQKKPLPYSNAEFDSFGENKIRGLLEKC
jgi:hypothetical protein